jgi:hypothetical protein
MNLEKYIEVYFIIKEHFYNKLLILLLSIFLITSVLMFIFLLFSYFYILNADSSAPSNTSSDDKGKDEEGGNGKNPNPKPITHEEIESERDKLRKWFADRKREQKDLKINEPEPEKPSVSESSRKSLESPEDIERRRLNQEFSDLFDAGYEKWAKENLETAEDARWIKNKRLIEKMKKPEYHWWTYNQK